MLGALLDLGLPIDALNDAVRSVLDCVQIESEQVVRRGFRATLARVEAPHEHAHRHLSEILEMIGRGSLPDKVKKQASEVFQLLAKAEAKVHGVDVEKIHFHEVGAADSIADIVGSVFGLDHLGIEEIHASPIPTGCGFIQIAHGTCSIPAPATAELLKGIPIVTSDVEFELTTPTGAALLHYFPSRFGSIPSMTLQAIGIGAGGRDLKEQANIFRLLVGDREAADRHAAKHAHKHEETETH